MFRIKNLEATIIILVELLRKHSVSIPDELKITDHQNVMHGKPNISQPIILRGQHQTTEPLPISLSVFNPTLPGFGLAPKHNEGCDGTVNAKNRTTSALVQADQTASIQHNEGVAGFCSVSQIGSFEENTSPLLVPRNIVHVVQQQQNNQFVEKKESVSETTNNVLPSIQHVTATATISATTTTMTLRTTSATPATPATATNNCVEMSLWRPDPSLSASIRNKNSEQSHESSEVHFVRINQNTPKATSVEIPSKTSADVCRTVSQNNAKLSIIAKPTTNSSCVTSPSIVCTASNSSKIATVASISIKPVYSEILTTTNCQPPKTTFATHCKQSEAFEANKEFKTIASSKRTTNALRRFVKSPIQGFGIENILVTSVALNNSSNSLSSTQSPFTTASVSQVNDAKNNCITTSAPVHTTRSRLPSSGHTVAALLENLNSESLVKCDNSMATMVSKNKTSKKDQKPSNNVDTSNTSKRWGSVVKKAQNSNMFLTSFVLENKANSNKGNKRIVKLARNAGLKSKDSKSQTSKTKAKGKCSEGTSNPSANTSPYTKKTEQVPATKSTESGLLINKPVSSNTEVSSDTITIKTTITSSFTAVFGENSTCEVAKHKQTTKSNEWKPTQEATKITTTVVSSNSDSGSSIIELVNGKLQHNKNTLLPLQTITTSTSVENPTNLDIPSTPSSLPVTRTMKDRTVKNKWLPTDKSHTIAPSISVSSTTDISSEQCASPVISYPHSGKRKRKTSNCQVGNVNKRSAPDGRQQRANSSSRDFSAESLSRSSKYNEKRVSNKNAADHFKNGTAVKAKTSKDFDATSTTLQSMQKDVQRLRHQPDISSPSSSSNTLPTILNIFAPAPVPTTATQQQTFQSAFSNFSAETLLGNECNIGVMDTNNMGDTNFNENMLIAANSQLFTNFSADTLISGSDTSLSFAVNNLVNQNNTNWNQPWLAQDMNDAMFTSMTGMQQNNGNNTNTNNTNIRNRNTQVSTECSPIKSIMSILNSSPNNNSNFHFENYPSDNNSNGAILPTVFPHHQTPRFPFIRDNRNNSNTDAGLGVGGGGIDLMSHLPNMWMNRPPNLLQNFNNKNNFPLNSSGMNSWDAGFTPALHTGMKVANRPMTGYQAVMMSMQASNIEKPTLEKNIKEKTGPTLGNFSLINSGTPT